MAFNLIRGRLLILPDTGKDDRGVIYKSNLGGWRCLEISPEPTEPGEFSPQIENYNHIIFIKEMATEIEIDGVTYLAMHRNAIVGILTD